jgi:heme/copper-type cytochrome/quinol oxidase subunit 3
MWIFLVADATSFAALLTAWAVLRVRADVWPARLDLRLGGALTYILLASSLTMSLSSGAAARGQLGTARRWLWLTVALGAAFLSGQALEWSLLFRQGIEAASDLQAATFFVCTGWHGAHVLAGLVALVAVGARRSWAASSSTLAMTALFWHFLDAVWILVFTLVYLV